MATISAMAGNTYTMYKMAAGTTGTSSSGTPAGSSSGSSSATASSALSAAAANVSSLAIWSARSAQPTQARRQTQPRTPSRNSGRITRHRPVLRV